MAAVMDLMLERKMFHVKLPNGVEFQASQYAFAPKPPDLTAFRPVAPAPAPSADIVSEISAPFQAFRAWAQQEVAEASAEAAPQRPFIDPTDPNGPVDDNALFASDLPQEP